MRTSVTIPVLSWRAATVGLAGSLLLVASASADENCGLCAKQIVTNSELATCFLDQYDQIAKTGNTAVVVDLSSCASRGVVEPLPSPSKAAAEPDVQFMISRTQLDCLKKKLETPGIVLDPTAIIQLDSCG
ncbi:hypothetical protein NKI32_19600 [Mesorhizobium sp. M0761]|uniref:hypothetical protein n=1 Tax=unclassified Mesorhizobium TaxID=325217 RepID=UPI00047CF1AE|nr:MULTISPECIES: hypothetical protein [unclassified Mesorhizobium]WJI46574.1 hypothetical protein NL532_08110 [Mesorhizobium sp. C120A]WJI61497.1 hypothetical protein NLY43_23200 [Mesorhizobium sp. C416B]